VEEFIMNASIKNMLLTVALSIAAVNVQAQGNAEVGAVSLVLGKAWLQSADDSRELIRAGSMIRVSDRIMTESNGHVHIKFIDQALVSVRPDSLLEIQRYDFNSQNPADSSIKLNLIEGITRAISGEGAHAARDRFRLNTPIAAIGVRGTDFVVSASEGSVRALVNEGAIVMAPFSNDCLVDNFGPCAVNAVELSQNSLQMVALEGAEPLPRLLPATDERGSLSREEVAVADSNASADDKKAGTEVYLETVTSRRVTAEASNTVVAIVPPAVRPPQPPVVVLPDFTPDVALASTSVTRKNLVWGRWNGRDGMGDQERLTLAYAEASNGRDITVGNATYGLFRDGKGAEVVKPENAVVSFALDSAQAYYHSGSGVVAMQVNSGALNINFNERSFATQLGLSHIATGNIDFSAAGRISDTGNFFENTDIQKMAGSVSINGNEAGYFFEKQLGAGNSVQGLTLWDAQ
jgi:hypothetical protein